MNHHQERQNPHDQGRNTSKQNGPPVMAAHGAEDFPIPPRKQAPRSKESTSSSPEDHAASSYSSSRGYSIISADTTAQGTTRQRDSRSSSRRGDSNYYGRNNFSSRRSEEGRDYYYSQEHQQCHDHSRDNRWGRDRSRDRADNSGWKQSQGGASSRGRDAARASPDRDYHARSARSTNKNSRGGDWECEECNRWNNEDLYRCQRCRTPAPRIFPNEDPDHPRRGRSHSTQSERSFSALPPAPAMAEDQFPLIQDPQAREWPPNFDEDGAAFVFDQRSGMFYESRSDFFYDPKSKLYYGNKKGAYFRYDAKQTPPFVEAHRTAAATTKDSEIPAMAIAGEASKTSLTTDSQKPTIAIKLKTKKFKKQSSGAAGSAASAAAPVIPTIPKAHQEHAKNIEKWTEKKGELQQTSLPQSAGAASTPILPPATTPSTKIVTTSKGEPICTVCRRKFPSIDKLRLHEKLSELHKTNLAKLAASQAEKRKLTEAASSSGSEYQDRAKKRRQLHGDDAHPVSLDSTSRAGAGPVDLHDVHDANPPDTLGEANIGNQLLQKLGWRPPESSSATATSNNSGSNHDSLRKDWDKIESIAAKRR